MKLKIRLVMNKLRRRRVFVHTKPRHLTFNQRLVGKGYRMGFAHRFNEFMFDRRADRDKGMSPFAWCPRGVRK